MDLSTELAYARYVVHQIPYIPSWEYDDAIGDAYLGLVTASRDWKEDGGANFITYSKYRIKGEVIDGLRRRTGRRSAGVFIKNPVEPLDDFHQPVDPSNPFQDIFDTDLRKQLGRAINILTDRQKMVLTLYFFEGMTMAAIGDLYGFSEARTCQIVAEASKRLYRVLVEGDKER